MRDSYRDGVRGVAPIAVAAVAFGVSFGLLARTSGFDRLAAVVMSATTFAGSAQFAAISVLGGGGTLGAAIAAAVLLNSRYAPIGISVGSIFPGRFARRALEAQLITDESWAVSARPGGRFAYRALVGAGLTLWVAWVAGTAIGVVAGGAIGDPSRLGLDGAFPALFVALLAPQLRDRRARVAAAAGAVIALALLPVAPAGVPIVVASAAALAGWRRA